MKEKNLAARKQSSGMLYIIQRVLVSCMALLLFLASLNPARISGSISNKTSLFTSAVSYNSLVDGLKYQIRRNVVKASGFKAARAGALIILVAVIVLGVSACISLGNNRFKRLSQMISAAAAILVAAGNGFIVKGYTVIKKSTSEKVDPRFPVGIYVVFILAGLILAISIINLVNTKVKKEEEYEMEPKYELFIMFLPFALLCFVFSYLPLWGWRYAFFDYNVGDTLSMSKWVGFKWFKYLFENKSTRADIVRVLRNTLAMSGLGILTSWIPLAFAIFLTEIGNKTFKRFVQAFTTIPNFISWILVYTVAFALFSTDGFVNSFINTLGGNSHTNYLMSDSLTWIKMLLWGIWKGVGWSAIIYIAGISGIDRQLYEAATVDGAGRFQRIWHVTVPGLMPTYMVMLLLSVAGMLSNGLDQYLVFSNASNMNHMEVLDLYVYKIGLGSNDANIPLSTVIGMTKSLVSVFLLFLANSVSKAVRKESII